MNDIYWVGSRESDIDIIRDDFRGSITIFGNNATRNKSFCGQKGFRVNHNMHCSDVDDFMKSELNSIINQCPDALFLFYDQSYAFDLGDNIAQHSIGLKDKYIYETLSDKLRTRTLLQNVVDTIPFISADNNLINYEFLCKSFSTDKFVIQRVISSGGEGTLLYDRDSSERIHLSNGHRYIASPYIEDAISINLYYSSNSLVAA